MSTNIPDALKDFRSLWWLFVVFGVITLAAGFILIFWPGLVTNFLDAEIIVDPNFEIIVPGSGGGDLSAPPTFDLTQPPPINQN